MIYLPSGFIVTYLASPKAVLVIKITIVRISVEIHERELGKFLSAFGIVYGALKKSPALEMSSLKKFPILLKGPSFVGKVQENRGNVPKVPG